MTLGSQREQLLAQAPPCSLEAPSGLQERFTEELCGLYNARRVAWSLLQGFRGQPL
jgi:hypothetical protein